MSANVADTILLGGRSERLAGADRSRWAAAARLARRNPTAAAGLGVLLLLLALALLAPLVAPYQPNALNPVVRLQKPSAAHLFGTDSIGQDVLSRAIYGARVSLSVGFTVSAISALLGTLIGACAGFFRAVDLVLMRIMDGLMAFPGLLLALALIAIVGPHLWAVILVLGAVQTPGTARLMRASVLSLRENLYVEAARAIGVNERRMIWRYILPNALAPLLVQATFSFASAVLSEAALSFLGTGIPPTTPSWGNIIGQGRAVIQQAPWLSIYPGLLIVMTVLAMSVLGDGLRDTLDPTLSRQM
ncbi:MAG TPA: ABC transporter permease [Dehalococcoidia bacterium]|nr:ABC transporter permease [Dehalococcoidia bacterium]